jgi:Trk-type K+ transport system membrane component
MRNDWKTDISNRLKIKKKLAVYIGGILCGFWCSVPAVVMAKENGATTDTGVSDVTDGIGVIKDLVLGCVGGVGVIFLAWGLLDFGTAYAANETTQQSQAIKKVVGGLIMVAVPAILKVLGVS